MLKNKASIDASIHEHQFGEARMRPELIEWRWNKLKIPESDLLKVTLKCHLAVFGSAG